LHRLPAELPRRLDIGLYIINEADVARGKPDTLGCQPKELGRWLLMTEGGGIEDAVEAGGEPEFVHEIGSAQMFLIGRQEHPRSPGPQCGEVVEQAVVQAGVILEPIVD